MLLTGSIAGVDFFCLLVGISNKGIAEFKIPAAISTGYVLLFSNVARPNMALE